MNTRVPEAVKRQQAELDAFDKEIAEATPPDGETPPEPPADPPPAEPPAPAPTADDWQQKFQTLQGKYNAEVPSLRNQVAALTQQIEDLKARPATPEPVPAAPAVSVVTDEDVETYGDDLIGLIRRVAVETDAGVKAKLQAEIAELREQMAAQTTQVETVVGSVTEEKRAAYFTDLVKAVPTYEEVDNSEAFKTWLLQPDEFSGLIRNDILHSAYFAFDAERTAKVFNAFIAQATPAPTPEPEPVVDPQAELAAQVSPGQGRAAAVIPADDGKKIWSAAEMDQFYKDVARGDYRGRREDVARIEADIDRALLEGRVRA